MSFPALPHKIGLVRHLIRNLESGEYFSQGKWTADARSATDFPTLTAAVAAEAKYRLKHVELVLECFPEPQRMYDIHLPLADR